MNTWTPMSAHGWMRRGRRHYEYRQRNQEVSLQVRKPLAHIYHYAGRYSATVYTWSGDSGKATHLGFFSDLVDAIDAATKAADTTKTQLTLGL